MSKILFGVAGEGSGHASRAAVVAKYLEAQGHTIKIITYHQGLNFLKSDFDVEEVFGLRFFHKDDKVDYPTTILNNIKKTPQATKSLAHTKNLIKEFKPDLILTDFEPLSTLCAYLCKIPLISIDNQHILTHGKIEFDKKWLHDYYITKTGTSTMSFKADTYILTSFFDFKLLRNNTYIVPPILRDEVLTKKVTVGKHILVYSTITNISDTIAILKQSPEKFIVYGSKFPDKSTDGNCTFKKFSKNGFLDDFASSKAVIGSAGLTLITEALCMKKPYLALPIQRRFEQLTNAYYLKKLHYGSYSEKLTGEDLTNFIKNLPIYNKKLSSYTCTDNTKLYKLLDKLIPSPDKK